MVTSRRCAPAAAAAKRQHSAFAQPRCINPLGGFLVGAVILSMAGASGGVECFLPASPLPSASRTARITDRFQDGGFSVDRRHGGRRVQALADDGQRRRRHEHRRRQPSSRAILRASEDDTTAGGGIPRALESIGWVSQPLVWTSLYSVATTGRGLPAGPGGVVGGLEGVAYLAVAVLAVFPKPRGGGSGEDERPSLDARTLSRVTIGLGLAVLAGVAASKGCVPNAKPILDYSAYFPVCGTEN